jgi:hypothetical protein
MSSGLRCTRIESKKRRKKVKGWDWAAWLRKTGEEPSGGLIKELRRAKAIIDRFCSNKERERERERESDRK